ncbi:cysteine-rich repeat secretory protein 38 isoform X2 [Populus trichocarpa]|nr:cysteine-rich repeat secretory protein 38 isoform X2 [Populus trichocarpa]|eukprot:XP_024461697.1 cysteine-rich repeat secretory protein 38 isoform X2 [Populus trichocarpa]
MSSSRFTSSLYLLTLSILLQNVLGVDPLYSSCSGNEKSTANYGSYKTSLDVLMSSFYQLAPAKEGFALGSLGQKNLDRPYGLVLCRGDVSSPDCSACVADATREIRKRCPYGKSGFIAYDNCLLKYSNKDFFGQIDSQNKIYLYNVRNVSNPVVFNQKTKDLLTQLANKAYIARKMYAAGELGLGGSKKLYGMAQCTRDLSSADCKKCLDGAISELQGFAGGKEGGRVTGGSCTVRYEIYPFVKA